MSTVVAGITVSLDGYVAGPDDDVGHLFDWYEAGDVDLTWPGNDMRSSVDPASAELVRSTVAGTGALVVGRRLYDITDGWAGSHPIGVPLFLVTHHPPESWPTDDAPFTAVPEGVAAAIEQAKAVAGDELIGLGGPDIIQQALALDLVDELHLDLAPVLLGRGISLFGDLSRAPVLWSDPEIVAGTRVTHLRFRRLPG